MEELSYREILVKYRSMPLVAIKVPRDQYAYTVTDGSYGYFIFCFIFVLVAVLFMFVKGLLLQFFILKCTASHYARN